MRVKCLAQEHNTMSLVRARTQTAYSGVKRTSHEATAPPQLPPPPPPGAILNGADSVHRLMIMILFTCIFTPEHLMPNKGNLSTADCFSILLVSNAVIT